MTRHEDQCTWVGVFDPRYQHDREVKIDEIKFPGRLFTNGRYQWTDNEEGSAVVSVSGILSTPTGQNAFFPRFLSLGCRGKKVEVQAVFQLTDDGPSSEAQNANFAGLSTSDSVVAPWYPRNITRCSLGSGPEPANTLSDCYECSATANVGGDTCKTEEGTWYEDTMILDMPEQCPPNQFGPIMPSIFLSPYQTVYVDSFSVAPIN